MNEKLKQILIDYAKQCEPHEMCGFVVFDGKEKSLSLVKTSQKIKRITLRFQQMIS